MNVLQENTESATGNKSSYGETVGGRLTAGGSILKQESGAAVAAAAV